MQWNAESSTESPSSSPRDAERRVPQISTHGPLTLSQSGTTTGPISPSTSATISAQPSPLGGQIKFPVHVPNYVSADDIFARAAATRTLKVSTEDVAAFTELLNQFREQDYLYVRRTCFRDPSTNHYAANYFHGAPSFAAPERPNGRASEGGQTTAAANSNNH
jgi:hypothetical protein